MEKEIERAKRYFEDEIHLEKTTYNCVNHYRQTIIDNHIILYKYLNELESDKQKLIEKLEEDKKKWQEFHDRVPEVPEYIDYILPFVKGEKE